MYLRILTYFILFGFSVAYSQDYIEINIPKKKFSFWSKLLEESEDKSFEKNLDISFAIGPSYSKESNFGLVGMASGLFRLDKNDSIMAPSNTTISASASLGGFYAANAYGNIIFPGRRSRLSYDIESFDETTDW